MLFCPAFTNSFMDRPQGLLDAIFATNFSAKSFLRSSFDELFFLEEEWKIFILILRKRCQSNVWSYWYLLTK